MMEYYSYNKVLKFSTTTNQKFEKNTFTFFRFTNLILICNIIWQQKNKVFSDDIYNLTLFDFCIYLLNLICIFYLWLFHIKNMLAFK